MVASGGVQREREVHMSRSAMLVLVAVGLAAAVGGAEEWPEIELQQRY